MSISRKKIVMILIMLFLLLASIFGTAYIDRVGEYKRAVKETTIEEVNISDIPDNAFGGCTNLTGITIPDGVKTIADNEYHCLLL